MSIKVSGLTKRYGSQKAVDGISFSLNKGEIVGFLGPNGAGKSTTMKIIAGFLQAEEGTAEVCDINVSQNNNATKRKIGYLPEANPLYHDMYVREYLSFVAGIHHIEKAKERIGEVIEMVGLAPESAKKIGQLSKGYKQRVGLAAALIHDPEVLILDEPTSGLDPNQIIEIRAVIQKLGQHKTVLFSSHILQEVEAICERVIIINKGIIVADDMLRNLGTNRQQSALTLKIKEDADPAVFKGAGEAEQVSPGTWIFQTGDIDGLKRKLMEIALQKNLTIISWENKAGDSLEDIFRSLTNKNT